MTRRGGSQRIPRPPGARPGRPAPWAGLAPSERGVTLGTLRERLAARGPARRSAAELPGVRAAAVLAPLYEEAGEVRVVLTRRAEHLRSHRGEISFPGGGQDKGETWAATALREAREEVGLDPSSVELIGELDHLSTVMSRSFIVPLVGVLPGPPRLVPNPAEVDRVLEVPLDELVAEGVFREERWGLAPLDRPVWFFELIGETIWGATAAMLRQLLAVALDCER